MPARENADPAGAETALSTEIAHLRSHRGQDLSRPLPQTIEESWRRCMLDYGLQPDGVPRAEVLSEAEICQLSEVHHDLLSTADAEVSRLFQRLAGNDFLVSLASPEGVMLRYRCDSRILDRLSEIGVLPGSRWAEERQGTNGVGTCLRTKRPVVVEGNQHYGLAVASLTCLTAPIFDARGEISGVINVTTGRESDARINRVVQDVIQRSAIRIENRCFSQLHRDLALLHVSTDPLMTDPAEEGVIALDEGGRIVALSSRARQLFGRTAADCAGLAAEELLEQGLQLEALRPGRQVRLNLAQGWIEARLTLPQQAWSSLRPAWRRPSGARLHARPPGPRQGAEAGLHLGPEVAEALARATTLLAAGLPLIVGGESGSGKTVFADLVARRCLGAEAAVLVVDCSGPFDAADLEGWLDGALGPGRCCLILDGVDAMQAGAQNALLYLLEHSLPALPEGVAVIATTSTDLKAAAESGAFPFGLLYRLKGGTFWLPPVRSLPDLDGAIDTLLALEAAAFAGRRPVLGDEARRLLANHHWPGNLRELRNALRHAASLSAGGEIGPEHLPDDIVGGFGRRDLSARSTREASRIEAALRHNGWNVTLTARYLGISRATLYRKIEIHKVRERTPAPGVAAK